MIRILLVLSLYFPVAAMAQKNEKQLLRQIRDSISGFDGDIGIFIKDLRSGKTIEINADTLFPTASIIKVPILVGITSKIENGELAYTQSLTYKDSLLYAGEDILGSFKNDEKITLAKVMMLMLTTSDNTASLWLQSLAGGGSTINNIMSSLGLNHTRVNSRTPGREENRQKFGWGQTTPREMATLFEFIYRKQLLTPQACEKMMRELGRNFWDSHALSAIPPTIAVFSKNGAVNESRSEVMLVNLPGRPYLFAVFTKNITDQSWAETNEAWSLTTNLSRLVYAYYSK